MARPRIVASLVNATINSGVETPTDGIGASTMFDDPKSTFTVYGYINGNPSNPAASATVQGTIDGDNWFELEAIQIAQQSGTNPPAAPLVVITGTPVMGVRALLGEVSPQDGTCEVNVTILAAD